ncbi:MAG: helix-turn-helix transcriptional regulator [Fibrobacteres bacterium]|nr:helix-turn-helix transcriptional regulator [Fibrobacterota bacterium]
MAQKPSLRSRKARPEGPGRPARPERRSYAQACGLAKALDVVGERWTLLLARDLMLGPKRFSELQRGLDGLAPNLLAARLKEMEALGLVEKSSASGARVEAYVLTAAGRELEPALHALGQWGFRYLAQPDPADRKELAWALFALKRRYRGTDRPLLAEIRCEGRIFQYHLEGDHAELREGSQRLPEILLQGEGDAFRALFFRGESASALRAAKKLEFGGSEGKLRDFLRAFALKA